MIPARQAFSLLVLCCAGLVCSVGLSQENGPDEGDREATFTPDEEVIVRGRTPATLRLQFEIAEDAVYDRFNEINSDDEFDIHCRQETLTGSRIPRRVCEANFMRAAKADAGQETVRRLQGGNAFNTQQFAGEASYKSQLLAEELEQLAAEDGQLRQALARLANLKQAMEDRGMPLASPESTSSRDATAGEDALPYDAAQAQEVRIGREPWRHALTHRTFTLAHVYGEIRAIDVDCDEQAAQLEWEAGAEWTLPDDWEACTLRVDAPPSTTFSLYEFE